MAKQYPDRVAFRYVAADGKTVVEKTYAQYVQDIRRAVTYFKENIPDIKGKRVGIMSRNCYEYGVNSFGAILAGAVVVTINQKKTWPELEYELGLAEPSLIVNDGIDYGCRPNIEAAYGDKLRPMDAFKDSAPAELVDCVGHDDLMVLMFTSGTTGRSKAVMLSERNFFTTVECQVKFGDAMLDYKHEHMPEDKNDVLSNFAILPLFHLGTFICLFVWACKGWALNLSADIRDFYRDLGLMHSDAIAVAPMLMEAIYKDVKRGRRARLNGIWNPCGSSAMFDGTMLAELAQQGMMITQVYGMTETCGAISGAVAIMGFVMSDGMENPKTKGQTYKLSREIAKRFGEKNTTTVCGTLKGIGSDKGPLRSCPGCIDDAIEIACDVLKQLAE